MEDTRRPRRNLKRNFEKHKFLCIKRSRTTLCGCAERRGERLLVALAALGLPEEEARDADGDEAGEPHGDAGADGVERAVHHDGVERRRGEGDGASVAQAVEEGLPEPLLTEEGEKHRDRARDDREAVEQAVGVTDPDGRLFDLGAAAEEAGEKADEEHEPDEWRTRRLLHEGPQMGEPAHRRISGIHERRCFCNKIKNDRQQRDYSFHKNIPVKAGMFLGELLTKFSDLHMKLWERRTNDIVGLHR